MSFRLAKPRRNSSLSISTSSSSLGGEERSDGPDRKQPYAKRENTDGRTPKRRTDPLKTILEEHKGQGESVEADGKVWGMPRWGDVVTDEVEPGIKVVSLSQVKELLRHYHALDTPTAALFPWLHGIGDGPQGADGPLEHFFGNPPLNPPRYRGLCLIRAPEPIHSEEDQQRRVGSRESESWEEMNRVSLNRDEENAGTPIPPSGSSASVHRRDTMSSEASSPQTEYSVAPSSLWDRNSAQWTCGSGGISPPTRTGSLISYPGEGSSMISNRKSDDKERMTSEEKGEDTSTSTEAGEQGMHPTCVKAPTTRNSKRTSDASALIGLGVDTEMEDAGVVPQPESHQVLDVQIKLEVPETFEAYQPPSSETLSSPTSPKSNLPPMLRRSISTPETPVSAHPSEQVSMLRAVSGRGKSRTPSPTEDTKIATSPNVLRTPDLGNLTIPEDEDDEDADVVMPDVSNSAPSSATLPQGEMGNLNLEGNCTLINSLRAELILNLEEAEEKKEACTFLPPDLGGQISLRNLMIQEIKYATISDLIIYAPKGLCRDRAGHCALLDIARKCAQAQETAYQERLELFYTDVSGKPTSSPGSCKHTPDPAQALNTIENSRFITPSKEEDEPATFGDVLVQAALRDRWAEEHHAQLPIRYNVFVIEESFLEIQHKAPQLVEQTAEGAIRLERDLPHREAIESSRLAGASMIADGVWLGNGRDDPFRPDRASPWLDVDLAIEAHDLADMPDEKMINAVQHAMVTKTKAKHYISKSRGEDVEQAGPLYLEVGSSSRSSACCCHSFPVLAERLIGLVECVYKLTKQKRKDGKQNLTILLFCEDGYTETSLFALTYLMYTRHLSLIDAYLTLHLEVHRSFFVYQFDLPFLQTIEKQIIELRGKPKKLASRPTSPMAKWNPFSSGFPRNPNSTETRETSHVQPFRKRSSNKFDNPKLGNDDWMSFPRFDGSLPSRIQDHLYLGNLAHATNGRMLKALGITHIVSVGETLSQEACMIHGQYVNVSHLSGSYDKLVCDGELSAIQVLDIQNVKDDGQDNLKPKFAEACAFMERARKNGGKTLVHCRVGVSRSATIVIAYLMEYGKMSLMDAYLMTRARRLNVLIQPSLLFLRESLHLESDLCERGILNPSMKDRWTWPTLCRDIWTLNKRYLVPQNQN